MTHTLTLTAEIQETDRSAIVAQIVSYNNGKAGPGNGHALFVLLHNEKNEVAGGLLGATGRGWLFVDHLVVSEPLRGMGIGTEMMKAAEAEAITRGCCDAWLNTFEFQARGFYEKLGYTCFGELPNYPAGFSRFFMKKSLTPPTTGPALHPARA
jgi:GNAT superfamily N-acetyltransferase